MDNANPGLAETTTRWLHEALGLSKVDTPFPWQEKLLERFIEGPIEGAIDIPTGLGKTAVMAIWLVARAQGAPVPRRLVYVVDRRAVVDQATELAENIRACVERNGDLKQALGLGTRGLPISTLRGQYVDNREWLKDPSSPAIVVGTVDMIGSRLLFEGYGVSRKMRPFHAALLGADSLVVLDEAHLVPPFERLLDTIAKGNAAFGPPDEALRRILPAFKLLPLSATSRSVADKPFGLTDEDLKHPEIRKRLHGQKWLRLEPRANKKLADDLAGRAWQLSHQGTCAVRIVVFCDSRDVAEDAKRAIEKLARGNKKSAKSTVGAYTELFVGGRRVLERQNAARWLERHGFVAGSKVKLDRPAFLFATSAGEVGVDLDADHMVADLVAWERMVQRLGRVNRRGDRVADVVVFVESEPANIEKILKKASEERTTPERKEVEKAQRTRAVRSLLERLPHKDGAINVCTGAFRALKTNAADDPELQSILESATTPEPLRPALSRPLIDAWSMTSLAEHTGRPEIDPWLRGWVTQEAQTVIVWRKHLPVRKGGTRVTDQEIQDFFEAAPVHASEMLETETYNVLDWLAARARALTGLLGRAETTGSEIVAPEMDDEDAEGAEDNGEIEVVGESSAREAEGQHRNSTHGQEVLAATNLKAFVLTSSGDLFASLSIGDVLELLDKKANKSRQKRLFSQLSGGTLVVDASVAGLSEDGLLDESANGPPRTADDGLPWMAQQDAPEPIVHFRVRNAELDQPAVPEKEWRERFRFAIERNAEGELSRWLAIDNWFDDSTTEEDRSSGRPQLLSDHQQLAESKARQLARKLGLPGEYTEMLAAAAAMHDEGKQAKRWQRAFNAPSDGVYAKTMGPVNIALLDKYRHEFGSLPFVTNDDRFKRLKSDDLRDLAMHLIAAHHGFGRPLIGTQGCADKPPSILSERAQDVVLRFVRLQKRWGPWGLAWWEVLLRAADQQASSQNEAFDPNVAKEVS